MLKQSNDFNKVFNSDSRTLSIKATVAGKDYTADDLTSIEYDSAAMTGESMGIGSTYENSVKITFANLVEGIKAKDKVTVSIGAELPNGAYEYAPLGVFYVDDEITMDRNNKTTEITADDGMCMLNGVYTAKVTLPTTLSDMALDIANQAGVTISQDSFSKLPEIGLSKIPTNQPYRTVLGWLAMMIPGYATFDRQGQLCLRNITGSTYAVSPDNYEYQGLTKNENPYTVTGITITQDNSIEYSATEQDGGSDDNSSTDMDNTSSIDETESADNDTDTNTDDSSTDTSDDGPATDATDASAGEETVTLQAGSPTGSVINVQNNLMTQDILNQVWETIQPIQYYPYTLNWFGNPAVEAGDWLEISDTQGNKFTVPNNSYVLTFDGGLSAVSSTGETVVSGTNWDYHGTLTQTIKQINQQMNAVGTYTFYTESDPVNPHEGDLWYKPNGDKTELYIYTNNQWISMVGDLTGKQIADQVNQAQQDIKNAKAVADAANTLAKSNNQDLQLKLGTDEFNTTVSQLTNDINLRVKSGDVISQINAEANQVLIQSGKILLDAPTVAFSGNAFIPSAAIKDLSADKLTAGKIDASTVNIVNMNANNISTGSLDASKISVTNLNANNIVAGTLSGKNMELDLDKGDFNSTDSIGNSLNIGDGEVQYIDKDSKKITGKISLGKAMSNDDIWDAGWLTYDPVLIRSNTGVIMSAQKSIDNDYLIGTGGSVEASPTGVMISSNEITSDTDSNSHFYNSFQIEEKFVQLFTWGANILFRNSSFDSTNDDEIEIDKDKGITLSHNIKSLILNDEGVTINTDFNVTGTKNAVYVTRDGVRATPAYEMAESYLGDMGEASTDDNGQTKIPIEVLFGDVVNTAVPYQVFIQPYSSAHVWVEQRNQDSFTVKSDQPNTPFVWELKAKRRGYEKDRLVKTNIDVKQIAQSEGYQDEQSN